MNDPSLEQLEQQLAASVAVNAAPPALRDAVLAATRRELRAQRWDRRLGRAAACLLVAGIGLNVTAGLMSERFASRQQALNSNDDLVRTAVAVAQATDAETGRLLAHQLAAWQGRSISAKQLAAIDAALNAVSRSTQL